MAIRKKKECRGCIAAGRGVYSWCGLGYPTEVKKYWLLNHRFKKWIPMLICPKPRTWSAFNSLPFYPPYEEEQKQRLARLESEPDNDEWKQDND